MCAEGHRPICQDTGIAMVFLKVGMNVRWDDATLSVQEMVNEGVRRAYGNPTTAARLGAGRPGRHAQEHQGQHPGRGALRDRARRPRRGHLRGQGRRLGSQGQVRHAEPLRRSGRLGAEDGADHGRRLVPARHPRHRHRRHAGKGHAAGQGSASWRRWTSTN
jgi:hypothetical protein